MSISPKKLYLPIALTLGGFAALAWCAADRFMKAENASFNAAMKADNDSFNAQQTGLDQQLYETDISFVTLDQSNLSLATQILNFAKTDDDASSVAKAIQVIKNVKQNYSRDIQEEQIDAQTACAAFSNPTQTVGISAAAIKAAQYELCVDAPKQISAARAQYTAYQWPVSAPAKLTQ